MPKYVSNNDSDDILIEEVKSLIGEDDYLLEDDNDMPPVPVEDGNNNVRSEEKVVTVDTKVGRIALFVAAASLVANGELFCLYEGLKGKKVNDPEKGMDASISDGADLQDKLYVGSNGEVLDFDRYDTTDSMSETILSSNSLDVDNTTPTLSMDTMPEHFEVTEFEFENLVQNFVSKNSEKYQSVSTEDIVKFISLANIDAISESNPELASQLFAYPSKEEFLNDAAKVIGATVMYDFGIWNNDQNANDFIKISDAIIGPQKEAMLKIEEYVKRIAAAPASSKNEIVSEFIEDMNSGSLSKLDDGVGFAAQVYIALISDGIAKDYLSQENFDMLQILKTSEKYISNIFAVYEKCNDNGKPLSR